MPSLKGALLDEELLTYLRESRVGYLATMNEDGQAHIVPVVFASDEKGIYFVVDNKRKNRRVGKLRRIENIERTGRATFLVDTYSEDWTKLSFLLTYCRARVLSSSQDREKKKEIASLLKEKYPQYAGMYGEKEYFPEPDNATFVWLEPERTTFWSEEKEEALPKI